MSSKAPRWSIAQLDAFTRRYRQAKPRTASEGQTQSALWSLLNRHPAIAWVARINSGAARIERTNADGSPRSDFVRFCRLRPGFRMPDLIGQLKSGPFFALEVKAGDWKGPGDEREEDQARYIDAVNRAGGRAGFVVSVETALEVLGLG